ncbi:hypothetical protein [Jeotgalibacillus marinus]|uniref:Uncharacterized protein n=1 Tax=Jeotgalibacillus marinus TaxID=86667 RepID=A0ABV3Q5G7_9BACL
MFKKIITSGLAVTMLMGGAHAMASEKEDHEATINQENTVSYSFDEQDHNFLPGISDYLKFAGEPHMIEHQHYLSDLPEEIEGNKGLLMGSNNFGVQNFLYTTKKVDADLDLKPNTTYNVEFDVNIATNAPKDSRGLYGSPADDQAIKAGVTTFKPKSEVTRMIDGPRGSFYAINMDLGMGLVSGTDAIMLGDMAKPTSLGFETYELKNVNNENEPFVITTDQNANLWLTVGTHSFFGGKTTFYLTEISVTAREVE